MSEAELLTTIRSLLIYCSLQLLSSVLLLAVLRRRYNLVSESILSFVLKTDWTVVQGLLVLWIIYVLQSSIQHVGTHTGNAILGFLRHCLLYNHPRFCYSGTDYTFKFQWLHTHDNK